ncbi:hypothetical protein VTJ04DRAFT_4801 [Mycothermus thermophilus]|uniref:uncharacterized protein n=1 Tax=Humicola insolens TaxID=85995 RepID=UPI00374259F1
MDNNNLPENNSNNNFPDNNNVINNDVAMNDVDNNFPNVDIADFNVVDNNVNLQIPQLPEAVVALVNNFIALQLRRINRINQPANNNNNDSNDNNIPMVVVNDWLYGPVGNDYELEFPEPYNSIGNPPLPLPQDHNAPNGYPEWEPKSNYCPNVREVMLSPEYNADEDMKIVCAICFESKLVLPDDGEDLVADTDPMLLPCGHVLGTCCLLEWLRTEQEQPIPRPPRCPICRFELRHPRCGHDATPCRLTRGMAENPTLGAYAFLPGKKLFSDCWDCMWASMIVFLALTYENAGVPQPDEARFDYEVKLATIVAHNGEPFWW